MGPDPSTKPARSDGNNSERHEEIPSYAMHTCPRRPVREQPARSDSDDEGWPYSRQDVAYANEEEAEQHDNQPVWNYTISPRR